jgi:hypothetical protein
MTRSALRTGVAIIVAGLVPGVAVGIFFSGISPDITKANMSVILASCLIGLVTMGAGWWPVYILLQKMQKHRWFHYLLAGFLSIPHMTLIATVAIIPAIFLLSLLRAIG